MQKNEREVSSSCECLTFMSIENCEKQKCGFQSFTFLSAVGQKEMPLTHLISKKLNLTSFISHFWFILLLSITKGGILTKGCEIE